MQAASLWAVHLSDGVLTAPWWIGGFLLAGMMWIWSARGIQDREIPRIGVVTAALFVASQFHLPTGVGTVHLLLNGLAGVLLGLRATLAIGVGLLLQSFLFEHGGRTTIGINTCIIAIPAWLAGAVFPWVRRSRVLHRPALRGLAVFALSAGWMALTAVAIQLALVKFRSGTLPTVDQLWVGNALLLGTIAGLAFLAAWAEPRLESDPDFALGLLLGAGTVALSVVLKAILLWLGGDGDWHALAAADLAAHTPVIVLEGLGVGFAVRVLTRAKPEWFLPPSVRP